MSPLNRTAASRLFAVASRSAFSRQAPRFASNQSFVAPNSAEVDNIQSRDEPPSPVHLTKGETKGSEPAVQNTPSHAPNYGAAVDYRTSAFSPVPKRVMDGSEPTETVAAAVVSGAPTDLQARTVRFVNSRLMPLALPLCTNTLFTASSVRLRPRLNLETGTLTTGAWIGTSSARVTAGRIL
jgi:hypothetical protein